MKKLVLGIVLVFCFQAAFIVYNATNPLPDMESIRISTSASDRAPGSYELAMLSAESEFADNDGVVAVPQAVVFTAGGPAYRAPYRARRSVRRSELHPTAESTASAKPEVIFKNEYAMVVFTPAFYDPYGSTPHSDKRLRVPNTIRKPDVPIKARGYKFK
jgi:hypothetical protein